MKELLTQIGMEPDRVEMFNMSAAMAGDFVAVAEEMAERVSALGPSPLHVAPNTGLNVTEGES